MLSEMDTDEPQTTGWADAMTKILQTKVANEKFLLSKAKKDRDIQIEVEDEESEPKTKKKPKRVDDLEVVGEDGKIVEQIVEEDEEIEEEEAVKKKPKKVTKKIERKKDFVWDRESELNSIATKGVVQLFNAVAKHRTAIGQELSTTGKSERKRDKVLSTFTTEKFMDTLTTIETEEPKKKWTDAVTDESIGANMEEWDSDESS